MLRGIVFLHLTLSQEMLYGCAGDENAEGSTGVGGPGAGLLRATGNSGNAEVKGNAAASVYST